MARMPVLDTNYKHLKKMQCEHGQNDNNNNDYNYSNLNSTHGEITQNWSITSHNHQLGTQTHA